ncbi:hypothetical protein [Streptomyces sp. URMC 124]|uniref:hypothetical protein n=1 Tax=Streptomyces sp. URMC 124 TaxID=3423405 RepID=UPI003F19AB98
MKNILQRLLTTVAATVLLTAGSAALAAPAHAEIHGTVLNTLGLDANGMIDLTGPGGGTLIELPNVLSPVV